MGWVSPTSDNEPTGHWQDNAQAYDSDTGTYALCDDDGHYLELILTNPISCDKVRIYCGKMQWWDADVDIDVYYGGAYHNIWSGIVTKLTWVEKEIGSTETVEKAQVKFNNVHDIGGYLYEFQFNEAEAPPPSYIPKVIMVT